MKQIPVSFTSNCYVAFCFETSNEDHICISHWINSYCWNMLTIKIQICTTKKRLNSHKINTTLNTQKQKLKQRDHAAAGCNV